MYSNVLIVADSFDTNLDTSPGRKKKKKDRRGRGEKKNGSGGVSRPCVNELLLAVIFPHELSPAPKLASIMALGDVKCGD